MVRHRKQQPPNPGSVLSEQAPVLPPTSQESKPTLSQTMSTQPQWLVLAVASGACAAFNGVFAKLTTTALTTTISHSIHAFLHLPAPLLNPTEYATRLTFFLLNLAFNAVMWALFTAALTRANSTTRVSIINTSANFLVTALAGWAVFGEGFTGLWFLGAALLVAGVVVIGRREEGEKPGGTAGVGRSAEYRDEDGERAGLLGDEDVLELEGEEVEVEAEAGGGRRKGEDVDEPIKWGE